MPGNRQAATLAGSTALDETIVTQPERVRFSTCALAYNSRVLQFAEIALVLSGLLSAGAVLSFSWSVGSARALLPCAIAVAGIGALAAGGLAAGQNGFAAWAFLFACAACGCGVNAANNLFRQPMRWVHRFVIYAGYGATFAGMGAVALRLGTWDASARLATAVFVGAYVAGSAGIFIAKTLTIRFTTKTRPEYDAFLATHAGGKDGPQAGKSDNTYW
jgi:hypothetical protein